MLPPTDPLSRSRMPLACAECRRLKLKCDKNNPCSSCIRRGCASICPQGRMVSKGSRLVIASTKHLHEKIDALVNRVRQLELALEASHSLHSSESHPLLAEELRLIATPIETDTSKSEPASSKEEQITEHLGTLTLDKSGIRYFGTSGAYALLRRDKDGPDGAVYKRQGEVSQALAELPAELAYMAQSFPVRLPMFGDSYLSTWILENALPPFPEAWSLVENYWEHYSWHFTPITRPAFVKRIFSPFYHGSSDGGDKPLGHRLALLFMVFAIGDLLDLTQDWIPSRGVRYYLLARASLCLDPVLESPTVTALQAMHLISIFLTLSRGTNEPEHAWVLSGINLKLALTMGLQHDANKFNLSPEEIENRQITSFSVLITEVWQALCVGRPPSQAFANFEWVFPEDQHSDTKTDPSLSPSTRRWLVSFTRECSCKVLDTVVGGKVTSYSDILQLDAKIREFPVLEISTDASKGPEELGIGTFVQRGFLQNFRNMSLLYLHRRCFALALTDCPDDPLKSRFAPSVMACHRIAVAYVSRIDGMFSLLPALTVRIWFIWPHVFASTLILGSIVARSPSCSLALPSMVCLEKVCKLWEASSESVCAGKVLEMVRQLKQKASLAFVQNKARRGGIDALDEIHALGGNGPRIISTTAKSASSISSPHSPESKVHSDSSQSPPSSKNYDPSSTNSSDAPSGEPNVDMQFSTSPAAFSVDNSFPSTEMPFDWENFDYSPYLPTSSGNTVPTNFDDAFGAMGDPAPYVPQNEPTLLEELGLGGEWQPVMDYLGL